MQRIMTPSWRPEPEEDFGSIMKRSLGGALGQAVVSLPLGLIGKGIDYAIGEAAARNAWNRAMQGAVAEQKIKAIEGMTARAEAAEAARRLGTATAGDEPQSGPVSAMMNALSERPPETVVRTPLKAPTGGTLNRPAIGSGGSFVLKPTADSVPFDSGRLGGEPVAPSNVGPVDWTRLEDAGRRVDEMARQMRSGRVPGARGMPSRDSAAVQPIQSPSPKQGVPIPPTAAAVSVQPPSAPPGMYLSRYSVRTPVSIGPSGGGGGLGADREETIKQTFAALPELNRALTESARASEEASGRVRRLGTGYDAIMKSLASRPGRPYRAPSLAEALNPSKSIQDQLAALERVYETAKQELGEDAADVAAAELAQGHAMAWAKVAREMGAAAHEASVPVTWMQKNALDAADRWGRVAMEFRAEAEKKSQKGRGVPALPTDAVIRWNLENATRTVELYNKPESEELSRAVAESLPPDPTDEEIERAKEYVKSQAATRLAYWQSIANRKWGGAPASVPSSAELAAVRRRAVDRVARVKETLKDVPASLIHGVFRSVTTPDGRVQWTVRPGARAAIEAVRSRDPSVAAKLEAAVREVQGD